MKRPCQVIFHQEYCLFHVNSSHIVIELQISPTNLVFDKTVTSVSILYKFYISQYKKLLISFFVLNS